MPSIGRLLKTLLNSNAGKSGLFTENGLPESMTPFMSAVISGILVHGAISQYTFNSRILLAMSWVY